MADRSLVDRPRETRLTHADGQPAAISKAPVKRPNRFTGPAAQRPGLPSSDLLAAKVMPDRPPLTQ